MLTLSSEGKPYLHLNRVSNVTQSGDGLGRTQYSVIQSISFTYLFVVWMEPGFKFKPPAGSKKVLSMEYGAGLIRVFRPPLSFLFTVSPRPWTHHSLKRWYSRKVPKDQIRAEQFLLIFCHFAFLQLQILGSFHGQALKCGPVPNQ